MPGPLPVTGPQVADQQLLAAIDVQGQKAVVAVVAVEKGVDLPSMHPVVGGIKIQDQLLGRDLKAADKLLKEHSVHEPSGFSVGPVFPPA